MYKQDVIEQRIFDEARYIIDNSATVRETAKKIGVSKSTVYRDVTERLPKVYSAFVSEVEEILSVNKSQRHIRGGEATRIKYSKK